MVSGILNYIQKDNIFIQFIQLKGLQILQWLLGIRGRTLASICAGDWYLGAPPPYPEMVDTGAAMVAKFEP